MSELAPARELAYEILRRTFEEGAWTDRAFTAAAARRELSDRELAQARRLTYGAVQRRGTSDHVIGLLAGRRGGKVDAAALAALRLGLYELLFSEAADHAAVDQAVELAKQGTRRAGRPHGRARAASGFVNALLRRAAAERAELLAGLDDSTPAGAAAAHSYPLWLVELWWDELGPAEARLLMAAMNEPAETALRVNTLRSDPKGVAADLRAAGIEVTGPGAGGLLDPADSLVVETAGDPVGARIATGSWSRSRAAPRPSSGYWIRSRATASWTSAPDRGSRPRRSRLASARRARSSRSRPTHGGPRRSRRSARASVQRASGSRSAMRRRPTWGRVTIGSSWTRPAPTSGRSRPGPTPAGASRRPIPSGSDRCSAGCWSVPRERCGPGGTLVYSTCTISALENEEVAAALKGYVGDVEPDDLGREHPRLASRRDPRFLQLLPERDRTTGFFCARFRRRGDL